jgi:hypothetical protein
LVEYVHVIAGLPKNQFRFAWQVFEYVAIYWNPKRNRFVAFWDDCVVNVNQSLHFFFVLLGTSRPLNIASRTAIASLVVEMRIFIEGSQG